MPQYRALVTYTVKISAGLTFEAADIATAATVVKTVGEETVPFDIQGTRRRHARGEIEVWDSAIAGFSIEEIVEEDEAI
jgi:hypothetical protein